MLNRRDFLKLGTAAGALVLGGRSFAQQQSGSMTNISRLQGWVDLPQAREWYESHVAKPYFETYRNLSGTGSNKQVLLWKAYEKITGRPFEPHFQTIGDCFAPGTIVLGEVTKPIEDVRVGDRVWTGEGKLTRVVSTRAIPSSKPLVKVHATGMIPLVCTEDHRFLVYRMSRVGKKRINRAYYERVAAKGTKSSVVLDTYESRTPTWVTAGELLDTDYLLTPTSFKGESAIPSGLEAFATPNGMYVLGYFAGNGHASGGSVEFTLPLHADTFRLANTLIDLGFNPKLEDYQDREAKRVRVHNVSLVETLRAIFYRGEEKQFPTWAIGDEDFLEGLFAADGSDHLSARIFDNTSHSLVYGVAQSLILLGHEPTINESTRSEGTYDNAKPLYRVTYRPGKQKQYVWRDDKFVCRPVKQVERLSGSMLVYDIGVEDEHHSFLANGVAVHNCVGHGFTLGAEVLSCTEIVAGEREEWRGKFSTEVTYAGSRVEIGGGAIKRGDGSTGAWAAEWLRTYGVVLRGSYGNIDLTYYNGDLAREWGHYKAGVPDEIEEIAKEHPVRTTAMVTSWESCCDAITNGYPVVVCSNVGFNDRLDRDGFLRRGAEPWFHCMLIWGIDTVSSREGGCIANSWGTNWLSGPQHKLGTPKGCFWADADVIDSMLKQGDSYALSGFEGFPSRAIDYFLL